MSQQDLLTRVIRVLEEAGVEYMVTGSLASSFYGEPRATHDLDLVVRITPDTLERVVAAFPSPDFYIDPAAAREAVRSGSVFNLLALTEGDKVDFWMLTGEPFDRSRFARRRRESVLGLGLMVPSPEDVILEKLRWSRLSGGSEKHYVDALRVYEVHGAMLDRAYLDRWAADLDVVDLWGRIEREGETV